MTTTSSIDTPADEPAIEIAKSACCDGTKEAPKPTVTVKTSCCSSTAEADDEAAPKKASIDRLLWSSLITIVIAYPAAFFLPHDAPFGLGVFAHGIRDMMNIMWWGILVGMIAVGLIDRVPREFVIGIIGRDQNTASIGRAVMAGFLLDLCNHGVLMVGAKLYERGASLGQVFAFLIASPWNSLSLTIIIGLMMGWGWMVVFIVASMAVALVTGFIVEALERQGRVTPNPNRVDLPDDFHFWRDAKAGLTSQTYDMAFARDIARRSVTASRMVLRWLLFGVVLAALIQAAVPTDVFATWLGATLVGLFATLIAATLIEVCSEGSVPIAADLMGRANAPGNAFTFLMAGAATDYTEILVLKQVTGRLKAALLLPLLTVPQILVIGWALNVAG